MFNAILTAFSIKHIYPIRVMDLVMVFNATFNNCSVLLVEKTEVHIENNRSVVSH